MSIFHFVRYFDHVLPKQPNTLSTKIKNIFLWLSGDLKLGTIAKKTIETFSIERLEQMILKSERSVTIHFVKFDLMNICLRFFVFLYYKITKSWLSQITF